MSIPVIEHIAEDIKTAIEGITEANGFNQDLTAIRPKRIVFANTIPDDLTVLIVQADETEGESPVGTKEWIQAFIIMALVIDSDKATDSIDTRINKVRADVEKKLKEDPYRGGHAIDTDIDSSLIFDVEEFSGIEIRVLVTYRVQYDDPYTQS